MLSFLKDLLPSTPEVKPEELQGADRVSVATCVLLLEVANADEEFSDEEREHIVSTLQARFDISEEGAKELIEMSKSTREASYDIWKFTNEINKAYKPAEKLEIMECVWEVIYADGTLDAHEDYLVHKLAKLLNLNHPQLIKTKMKVLNKIRGNEQGQKAT